MSKNQSLNTIKITASIKPSSRQESIEWSDLTKTACIKINAPPVDNKANSRVIELLSDVIDVPKSRISIVKGFTSKLKTIEIIADLSEETISQMIKNFAQKKR